MSNITLLRGSCYAPFFEENQFPDSGGYIPGRFCATIPGVNALTCCLPCPATDWVYPDNFYSLTRIAGYLSIAGLFTCVFFLLSFALLPVEKTRRHYLNVGLIMSVVLLQLGFIIPLGVRPEQCHNEITPNDMYSSVTCAWSGALIVSGGLTICMWIAVRALSMHLQICWNIVPGRKFFFAAQTFAWGFSAVLLTICLTVTGVSFRFGDYCHVNHYKSLQTLFGPLLGVAALSVTLQISTFAYCLKVYLQNLWVDQRTNADTSLAPLSSKGTAHAQKTRAVYRRVKRVLSLQWRGLVIIVIVLTDVVFFSIVFVVLDNQQQEALQDISKSVPWVFCLVTSGGDKDECMNLGANIAVPEGTLIATLIMLAVVGLEGWPLIACWSMITGWTEYFGKMRERREFVSLDATRLSADNRQYEGLPLSAVTSPYTTHVTSPYLSGAKPLPRSVAIEMFDKETQDGYRTSSPSNSAEAPPMAYSSPLTPSDTLDSLDKETGREYRKPRMSFSSPNTPSSTSPRSPITNAANPAFTVSTSIPPWIPVVDRCGPVLVASTSIPIRSTNTVASQNTLREWDPSATFAKSTRRGF